MFSEAEIAWSTRNAIQSYPNDEPDEAHTRDSDCPCRPVVKVTTSWNRLDPSTTWPLTWIHHRSIK